MNDPEVGISAQQAEQKIEDGERMDRVLVLLFVGMVLAGGTLLAVDKWWSSDGQIFQCFSTLLAGFSGSFFTRLQGHSSKAPVSQVPGGPK